MSYADRTPHNLVLRQVDSLRDIDARQWNRLVEPDNPFLRHEFLCGLERHDCLEAHGWVPCHLLAFAGESLAGAVPLFLRTNSYGEFVFDWGWADAYERAGGHYYPKLVSAIPFTPVSGRRLLLDTARADARAVAQRLIDGIVRFCEQNRLSSFHCLFPLRADADQFLEHGLLLRKTCQFHWRNDGYRDFDDFLDALTSKRRKQIRRERRRVADDGVEIEVLSGPDISERHWEIFFDFYCSTFHRRWGSPRLTLEFFKSLSSTMPDAPVLMLGRHGKRYVAGAFAMVGRESLYGRHWGCSEDFPFLHFELCYYQTIEFCITRGLQRVDAGVQGEHKLSRGFLPVATLSCHWIRHQEFRDAIQQYLARETPEMDRYIAALAQHLPFKRAGAN